MSAPQPPTISELQASIKSSLESRMSITIPLLEKAFLWVVSVVFAGVLSLLYKYVSWWAQQPFAQFASFEEVTCGDKRFSPLIEIGVENDAGYPKEATRAELVVDVATVTDGTEPYQTLSENEALTSDDNDFTYLVKNTVTLDAETVQATIIASADPDDGGGYGASGNLQPGATLSFAKPVAYVSRTVTVASQAVTAADAESEDAYRGRVRRRRARPLQGGAYADYEAWGEGVPGILRCYPQSGDPGEILAYIEATVESSGSDDGIPTTAQLEAVETAMHYDDAGKRTRAPGDVPVTVLPISRAGMDVEIIGLDVEDETGCKADVESALDEYFRSLEVYIVGLSIPPRKDRALSVDVGGIISDVVRSYDGTFASHVMSYSGDTLASFPVTADRKLKLNGGVATWS